MVWVWCLFGVVFQGRFGVGLGLIGCSFGVGTNLTNDVGLKPLNMVIKLKP